MKNYIRFGVQKKKKLLQKSLKTFDGLIVPGNILLYQYKASPASILQIGKEYLIDPMSYLFGENYESFKKLVKDKNTFQFKPSFEKLLIGHGLKSNVILEMNSSELRKAFLTNSKLFSHFVASTLSFQKDLMSASLEEIKKLEEKSGVSLLKENEHLMEPTSIIPPYFFMDQNNLAESLLLNKKIIEESVEIEDAKDIRPLIYLNKVLLKDSAKIDDIVKLYTGYDFPGFILWVDDFNEYKDSSKDLIKAYAHFVSRLATKAKVTLLHAGFFGMLLSEFGVEAICHGLGYGEVRSGLATSKGGGPPPVRYYIRDLHTFMTLEKSLYLLRQRPELLCTCPVCERVTKNDPENIMNYDKEDDLADLHYLYVRAKEKKFINELSFDEKMNQLDFEANDLYDDLDKVKRIVTDKRGNEFEESFIDSNYIKNWVEALREAKSEYLV